jgi:hypothetical protein
MGIRLSGEIVRQLRKMNVFLLLRFGVDLALELVFALDFAHLDLALALALSLARSRSLIFAPALALRVAL